MSEPNEPCESPKRSVGILLYPPSIGAPCDCYTDVLFPIGSIASLISGAARRFFARTALTKAMGMLGSKVAPLSRIRESGRAASKAMGDELTKLAKQIEEAHLTLENLKQRLKTTGGMIAEKLKEIDKVLPEAQHWGNGIKKYSLKYNIGITFENGWPILPPSAPTTLPLALENAIHNYKSARNKLLGLRENLDALKGLQQVTLPRNIQEATKIFRGLEAQWAGIRPAIDLGGEVIPEGGLTAQKEKVDDLLGELTEKIDEMQGLYDQGLDALGGSGSMVSALDRITGRFADISGAVIQLILDLISALSIMEKINCKEASMLDESTCLCTNCPPDKVLCSPPAAQSWTNILPQFPGTSMGTELNECVYACCSGMEFSMNRVYNPCGCVCSDGTKVEKPCKKADCVAKLICAGPEPDAGELGFFGTSKYRWDENECDWVCKDGMCTTTTSTTGGPTTSTTTTTTTTKGPTTTTTTTSGPTTTTTTTTSGPTTTTTTPEPCNCPNTVNVGFFSKVCQCDWDYTFYKCVANKGGCEIKDPYGNMTVGVCVGNSNSLKNNPAYEWKELECAFGCKNGKTSTSCKQNETWRAETCECIPPTTTCAPCPEGKHRKNFLSCNTPCVCFDCLPEGMIIDDETCECACNPDTACKDLNKRPKADATYPICECECKTSCDSPLVQNTTDCSCGCPSGPFPVYECVKDGTKQCIECFTGGGNTYNPDTCSCECAEECPSPKVHKAPSTGPNGVIENPTCLCYCPENDIQCECKDVFGGETCGPNRQYVKDITAPGGCKCQCIETLSCGTNETFDDLTCACECKTGTSKCDDICYENCLWGQTRKPGTCNVCSCPDDDATLCTPAEWPIGPGPKCVKCGPNEQVNDKCECVPITTTTAMPTTTTSEPTTTSGPTTSTTSGPTTSTTVTPTTTTTTTAPSTTNGPTTQPPCGDDSDCEPFCCVDGICGECPPVEYKWYCTNC
jgi:hypothetical protein